MAILQVRWYFYLLLAVIDVEANYLGTYVILKDGDRGWSATLSIYVLEPIFVKKRVLTREVTHSTFAWHFVLLAATKAYQYTSITSVMLLDCWTIPCVMVLTWFLLKTHYLRGHFIGVALCVLGLGLVLLSDVHESDRSGSLPPKPQRVSSVPFPENPHLKVTY